MTEQRLVALCDILGFSDTIRDEPLERVIDDNLAYFRRALKHVLGDLQGKTDLPDDFEALKAATGLGIEWFSDTLILYTRDDKPADNLALIQAATWLTFELMYHPRVRLRVGIDYGDLHVSRNAGQLLGRAIVGAHDLERHQDWAGGALTPAAVAQLDEAARFYVTDYSVPLKARTPPRITSGVALNWTLGVHLGFNLPFSRSSRTPTALDREKRPDIVTKWEQTTAFHNAVCSGCTSSKTHLPSR